MTSTNQSANVLGFWTCIHEAGHAVAALRFNRPVEEIVFSPNPGETLSSGFLGQIRFAETQGDSNEPEYLRDTIVIALAGSVASLFIISQQTKGCLMTNDEIRDEPNSYPHIFRGQGDLAQHAIEEWQVGTDSAALGHAAFAIVRGELLPRTIPLSPEWEQIQRSAEFIHEIEQAEQRAADLLRANWEIVLRLAHALQNSQSGRLTGDEARSICGELTRP